MSSTTSEGGTKVFPEPELCVCDDCLCATIGQCRELRHHCCTPPRLKSYDSNLRAKLEVRERDDPGHL